MDMTKGVAASSVNNSRADLGDKVFTYYQGCSEGGREGWSQAQRFPEDYDGIIAGAPAFRYSHQQINHMSSSIMEKTLGYFPPPCELDMITNATITYCDALDGKTDGVVARSDLCALSFDLNTTIGLPYSCEADQRSGTPAQSGFVTAEAVEVAHTILRGLMDSEGRRVYLSYQPGADFDDAETSYDSETGSRTFKSNSVNEYVYEYLQLQSTSSMTLDNVTYDDLKYWMGQFLTLYGDTLQTTNPDLTPARELGTKILHYHGEQDSSIPTASSVHYYESVRQIMYPGASFNECVSELDDFYRFFIVPGAGHCMSNTKQPNGPFPSTNLAVMIDWVENGKAPDTLNATVASGVNDGEVQDLCRWPLRPKWSEKGVLNCEYDQRSIDTWLYDFDAFKIPIY